MLLLLLFYNLSEIILTWIHHYLYSSITCSHCSTSFANCAKSMFIKPKRWNYKCIPYFIYIEIKTITIIILNNTYNSPLPVYQSSRLPRIPDPALPLLFACSVNNGSWHNCSHCSTSFANCAKSMFIKPKRWNYKCIPYFIYIEIKTITIIILNNTYNSPLPVYQSSRLPRIPDPALPLLFACSVNNGSWHNCSHCSTSFANCAKSMFIKPKRWNYKCIPYFIYIEIKTITIIILNNTYNSPLPVYQSSRLPRIPDPALPLLFACSVNNGSWHNCSHCSTSFANCAKSMFIKPKRWNYKCIPYFIYIEIKTITIIILNNTYNSLLPVYQSSRHLLTISSQFQAFLTPCTIGCE